MQRHPINAHFAWRTVENSWTPENGLLAPVSGGVPYSRHEFRIVRGWAGFADHQSPRRYRKRGKGGGGRYGADVLI